jgi:hypothetical protein
LKRRPSVVLPASCSGLVHLRSHVLEPSNAPVQRRAAQRAVRCNRLLGRLLLSKSEEPDSIVVEDIPLLLLR